MALLKSAQIEKIQSAFVGISGFAASGTSTSITTALTTALGTAGDGGVAVPVQPSTGVGVFGVITSGSNQVAIFDANGDKILSGENIVYGRITESGGAYTLTYYYDDAGTETAYTMTAQNIDVWFAYRFTFATYPTDAGTRMQFTEIDKQGTGGAGQRTKVEVLSVTAQDTMSALTFTPVSVSEVILSVRGKNEDSGSGGAFSVSGKNITWSYANAGYHVETTDRVTATYSTAE